MKDPNLAVMWYVQVLGLKRIVIKEEMLTLIKASDDNMWNVVIDKAKENEILGISTKSVIKLSKVSVNQVFRLIVLAFKLIPWKLFENSEILKTIYKDCRKSQFATILKRGLLNFVVNKPQLRIEGEHNNHHYVNLSLWIINNFSVGTTFMNLFKVNKL